jgi:hypothetical protein
MRITHAPGFVAMLLAAIAVGSAAQPATGQSPAAPAVVLVTLDGARIEEMFGGLDLSVRRGSRRIRERRAVVLG